MNSEPVRCTICDPRPEATDEECDKWPGHFRGCLVRAEGKPINGWDCDGCGNLTPADGSRVAFLEQQNAELLAVLKEVTETLYRHLERPRQSVVLRKAKAAIARAETINP